MTAAGELYALAERCEQATGPSVLLDAQIYHDGLGLPQPKGDEPYCPRYTASLDAAMTLVPEGWSIVVGTYNAERGPFARLFPPDYSNSPLEHQESNGCATMALALCAAALRARAAQIQGRLTPL